MRLKEETKAEFDKRFKDEMSETVDGMHRLGLMDDAAYKLTMRDLNRAPPDETESPLTSPAHVSSPRRRQ